MDGFLNGFFETNDELSFLNFGVFFDFTSSTSFLVSVESLKSPRNRVFCFLTASNHLILEGSVITVFG